MEKELCLLIIVGLFNVGCNAVKTAQVPPGTSASYTMRGGIVRTIDSLQKMYDPGCKSHAITDARVAGSQDMTVLEEWSVLACGTVAIYDIQITHSPYGGTTYNVTRRK